MTKFLQELLTTNEPLFPMALHQLEKSVGHEGVDVRLIADITHKTHEVMRQLNLDPADTTARELYLALNAYIERNNEHEILFDADFILARINNEIISFNLIDVIENSHHQLKFEKRGISHAQRSLRGEIVQRYLAHPRTVESTTQQLAIDAGLIVHNEAPRTVAAAETNKEYSKKEETNMSSPYILSIGDIFTDAFIKLNEDVARIDTDEDGSKRISIPFGSKPPYDRVDIVQAVGPAPNAAVSFARLGLTSGLDTFLGDDEPGKESLTYLAQQNVLTDTVLVEEGMKSNYYYVLRYGAERTILVKNEQYDYTWSAPNQVPDWVYLALVSDASWQLHSDLVAYLNAHPQTKLAFQPGTFHFKWGKEKLAEVYKRSHILVMNREEAVDVTGASYDSIRDLANALHDLGPHIVVITDGPNGSYASYDYKLVTVPNYPDPGPPVDRTGAGDAFASTIVAALAMGETMETALLWAPINSMNVVQSIGAQGGLLTKEEIQKYLDTAPEWYQVKDLEA